jgi:hypothetical protein
MFHKADKECKKDDEIEVMPRKNTQVPEEIISFQAVNLNSQNSEGNENKRQIEDTNQRIPERTASTKNAIQAIGNMGKDSPFTVCGPDGKNLQLAPIPRVMSFRLYDPPIIKTLIIELEETEMVGDEWFVVQYAKFLQTTYESFTEYMNTDTPKLIYNIWSLVCLIALLGVYIWDLIVETSPSSPMALVLQFVIIGLDLIFGIWVAIKIYFSLHNSEEPRWFSIAFTWIQWQYFGGAVCLLSLFLIDQGLNSFIYLAAIHSIWIVSVLIFYGGLLSITFMIIFAILEWLVRTLACQAKCPKAEKKTKSYTYSLYRFKECCEEGGKMCSVCLHEFEPADVKLVVLGCHSEHIFHEDCILEWAKTRESCPICRSDLSFKTKG